MVEYSYSDGNGNQNHETTVIDASGNKISDGSYIEDGVTVTYHTVRSENNGEINSRTETTKNGKAYLSSINTLKKDANGNTLEDSWTYYDEDGNAEQSSYVQTYSGNQLIKSVYSENGAAVRTITATYSANGELASTKAVYHDNSNPDITITYTYTDGLPTTYTQQDGSATLTVHADLVNSNRLKTDETWENSDKSYKEICIYDYSGAVISGTRQSISSNGGGQNSKFIVVNDDMIDIESWGQQ